MLEVDNINVAYGDVQVLWDISLKVKEKEIVTVIGPNGAGKSTLLKTIAGLLHPLKTSVASSIIYMGRRIDGMTADRIVRLGVALVPGEKSIFPQMTVLDNLLVGSYIKKAKEKREESLDMVFKLFPRLKERLNQQAGTLSGGERQMLAVGQGLMANPTLLLVDEPSLGLQPTLVSKIFETIKKVREIGVTVLLVEQNVYSSLGISDKAYVLENGRVVLKGAGEELLDNEHVKKAYLAI